MPACDSQPDRYLGISLEIESGIRQLLLLAPPTPFEDYEASRKHAQSHTF